MAIRASSLYDKEVYLTNAKYVGYVDALIVETEEGAVVGLKVVTEDGRTITIPYELVEAVGDIILVRPPTH